MDLSSEKKYLDAADYAILIAMLGISAFLGIYFACVHKKKPNTTSEYLIASQELSVFPIAMSLSSSYISAVNFLGQPSEAYQYGSQLILMAFTSIFASIFMTYALMPVFYDLKIISCYQYLTKRFNYKIGMLGSVLFLIKMLAQTSVVIYTPAIALAQLSGISFKILIPILTLVCIFYTSIGGLRAVVWADTLQMFIMLIGAFTLAILGIHHVGGFENVWERNENSGRIEFFKALWIFSIMIFIILFVNGFNGLVIFSIFHDCDPVSAKIISKVDQIVPYTWMFLTKNIPTLPGIFITAIFSASFSTVSTILNSMAGVFVIDVVKPLKRTPISEAKATFLMKIMVIIFGCILTFLAFMIDKVGGIFQASLSFNGAINGPLFGVFLLGIFFPKANSKGVLVGGLVSFGFLTWICVGAQVAASQKQILHPKKPFSIEGCDNGTLLEYYTSLNETRANFTVRSEPFPLYAVSYFYYALIGVFISVVVGLIVSLLTGGDHRRRRNAHLYSPIIRRFVETKSVKSKEMILNDAEKN